MSNLTKIKTTDNTQYNIKDNSGSLSSHWHHDEDLKPLISKTYASTSYYATTNDYANASWYFMSVKPNAWYQPWTVRLKVRTKCPNQVNWYSYTWATISGRTDGVIYANWNEQSTTAHTYITFYPLKQAGFNAGYGHAIGISIYNGNAPTTANNYRTFEIDYYSCDNCTVNILDTPVKWTSWTGTGTTNYGSLSSFNANSRGLQESGDANDIDAILTYFGAKTGAQGIWAGSLFMQDGNKTYQNICTASDGTATNANRTTATTKLANANGFLVGGTIYYSSANYNANTNISNWGAARSRMGNVFDARYSFNVTLTANSLTPYAPVYLVGTINSTDGLFYLDQVWWTQTPNATDKIYVLVGGVYDSTTSNCRIVLYEDNPWYRYDGTKLVDITTIDTTYPCYSGSAGGTDVTLVTTGDKYNWDNTKPSTIKVGTTPYTTTNGVIELPAYPTVPTVNNATLTINQNNTSKGTFTANQATDQTINLTDTTYESLAEASGGNDVSLVTTGDKWNWNRTLPFKPGLEIASLNDLVGLMNYSTDKRCFSGVIKITTDIGVGVTGWQRILAMSQNAVNNGTYDVGMCCIFFPNDINIPIKYAIINGISDNNYTVTDTGALENNRVLQSPSTSSGNYRVLLSNAANDNEETKGVKKTARILHNPSNGTTTNIGQLRVDQQNGTASATADSYLFVGNDTAAGTAGNSRGVVRIYDTNDKYVHLIAGNGALTANRTATLPNKTGTIAMTSDIVDEKIKVTRETTGGSVFYPISTTRWSTTAGNVNGITGGLKVGIWAADSELDLLASGGGTLVTINSQELCFETNGGGINNGTAQRLRLSASNESNYYVDLGTKESTPAWCFAPAVTKKLRLGSPSYLWTTIYAQTGSINTSDRNEKKDILPLDETAKDFIMALNPVSYKFKDGESGRTHYGMIAQDVEEEMEELGMTPMDFAGFCKDQKTVPYVDSNGDEKDMPVEGQYAYGLRYEEFMAPAIKTIQLLQNQVDAQQQEINELKQQLAEIKTMLNGGN